MIRFHYTVRWVLGCGASAVAAWWVTWVVMRSDVARSGAGRAPAADGWRPAPPRPGAEVEVAGPGAGQPEPGRARGENAANALLSAEAMEAGMRAMADERDPVAAMGAFSELLKQLTPENAAAAWGVLAGRLQGAEAVRYLPLLAHAWGTLDGPGAMKALTASHDREGLRARATALGGWASQDPEAAVAWYRDQRRISDRDPRDDHHLEAGLVRGLAAGRPDDALSLIAEKSERARAPLMNSLMREQYARGLDAAAQWAGRIADADVRDQALASLVRHHAEADPAQAAAWLADQPELRDSAPLTGELARQWAARDPDQAVAWIQSLPESAARTEAWEDAVRAWSRRDPLASSRYLAQLPAGPSRDAAVSSLSRSIARQDPDAAIQWAATIQDPAARDAALVRTVQLWRSVDETAAASWVHTSGLHPQLQQRMLDALPDRKARRAEKPGAGRRQR